jgi:hypothetical protein
LSLSFSSAKRSSVAIDCLLFLQQHCSLRCHKNRANNRKTFEVDRKTIETLFLCANVFSSTRTHSSKRCLCISAWHNPVYPSGIFIVTERSLYGSVTHFDKVPTLSLSTQYFLHRHRSKVSEASESKQQRLNDRPRNQCQHTTEFSAN